MAVLTATGNICLRIKMRKILLTSPTSYIFTFTGYIINRPPPEDVAESIQRIFSTILFDRPNLGAVLVLILLMQYYAPVSCLNN